MTFTYEPEVGVTNTSSTPVERRVELPRRTVQILGGDARFSWKHSIMNDDLKDERRISLVFRDLKTT